MISLMEKPQTNKNETRPLQWEHVPCNLCAADATDLYHRERLPYFDNMLSFDIVQCRNCGLVYTNPRLADHNATYLDAGCADADTITQHDRAKQRVFTGALDEIERWLDGDPGQSPRLLDVGCGSGHFLALAQQRGFDVTGIEPAATSADYAQHQYGLSLIRRNILQAELPPESFDVITAWDVIEHVADPQAVLQKCVTWLRPGGVMALRFPSARWQKIKGVILHRWLAGERPAFSPTMHLYFFNEDTFAKLAQKVHLDVLRTRTTPLETHSQNRILASAKATSSFVLRALAAISGKHLGNLEVYCRKTKMFSGEENAPVTR